MREVITEVIAQLDFPMNDEWYERFTDELKKWLAKEGSSVHSLSRFAIQFNSQMGEAEARAYSEMNGD